MISMKRIEDVCRHLDPLPVALTEPMDSSVLMPHQEGSADRNA